MITAEPLFKFCMGQRAVKQKSLRHAAVDAAQKFCLFLGLYAFCDHFHVQIVYHVYKVLVEYNV